MGKQWKQWQILFSWPPKSLQTVTAAMKLNDSCALEEKLFDNPRQHIKKQRDYFTNKGPYSQSYGFSSYHVQMYELDHKESWPPKNWWFWIVVLEKTLNSPLDCNPVNPKGNQPWIFIGSTDAEAEVPVPWPSDAESWLIGKDSDAGKDWREEEKGTTEDDMVGLHHQLNGHEFGKTSEVGDGQGCLACCIPWGCTKSDTTERVNWTKLKDEEEREPSRHCCLDYKL